MNHYIRNDSLIFMDYLLSGIKHENDLVKQFEILYFRQK